MQMMKFNATVECKKQVFDIHENYLKVSKKKNTPKIDQA